MSLFRHIFRFISYSAITLILLFSGLLIIYVTNLPELKIWHTTILSSDFKNNGTVSSFKEYLLLEKKLFEELDAKITSKPDPQKPVPLNRYYPGSRSNPKQLPGNINQSYVIPAKRPKASVLLLHGMSDSPYSLRHIGKRLSQENVYVVGLRYPGHGTLPSSLLDITWEDMMLSVSLAIDYLKEQVPDKPVYIIGYSTGGALGLLYVLSELDQKQKSLISGVVLISPAIGITPVAALARGQEIISRIPGMEKLSWTDIGPEYNPVKYTSFPVNAGNQVYRLTKEIKKKLADAQNKQAIDALPPIIAFQSIADSTVSTSALIKDLYLKLNSPNHELIVFDINRRFSLKGLIKKDEMPYLQTLLTKDAANFTLTLVTNFYTKTNEVQIVSRIPGKQNYSQINTLYKWPEKIYSLSHVALPFPKNDPVYGTEKGEAVINLGDFAIHGERGVLAIPANEMLRLKWNPFYIYMEKRILEILP